MVHKCLALMATLASIPFANPSRGAEITATNPRTIVDIGPGAKIYGPVTVSDEAGLVVLSVPAGSKIVTCANASTAIPLKERADIHAEHESAGTECGAGADLD